MVMVSNYSRSQRIGIFTVSMEDIAFRAEEIAEIFAKLKMLPLKVEMRPDIHAFEYMALCEKFEIVPLGQRTPQYRLIFTYCETGITDARVERI